MVFCNEIIPNLGSEKCNFKWLKREMYWGAFFDYELVMTTRGVRSIPGLVSNGKAK